MFKLLCNLLRKLSCSWFSNKEGKEKISTVGELRKGKRTSQEHSQRREQPLVEKGGDTEELSMPIWSMGYKYGQLESSMPHPTKGSKKEISGNEAIANQDSGKVAKEEAGRTKGGQEREQSGKNALPVDESSTVAHNKQDASVSHTADAIAIGNKTKKENGESFSESSPSPRSPFSSSSSLSSTSNHIANEDSTSPVSIQNPTLPSRAEAGKYFVENDGSSFKFDPGSRTVSFNKTKTASVSGLQRPSSSSRTFQETFCSQQYDLSPNSQEEPEQSMAVSFPPAIEPSSEENKDGAVLQSQDKIYEDPPFLSAPSNYSSPPPSSSRPHTIWPNPGQWEKSKNPIGIGSFGSVYMCQTLETGDFFAAKQVYLHQSKEQLRQLRQEMELLKKIGQHPNIVQYIGMEVANNCLYIFLEYAEIGSLTSALSKFHPPDEGMIRLYTRQILTGLQHLHSQKILHRDIKGSNILVGKNGTVKLADFGLSKRLEENFTRTAGRGTVLWMAPEVIAAGVAIEGKAPVLGYGKAADIWSVGCTVIEMANGGRPPWLHPESMAPHWAKHSDNAQTYAAANFNIGQGESTPPIPNHLSDDCQDFIRKCCQLDPKKRPSAQELLEHPFVAEPLGGRSLRDS